MRYPIITCSYEHYRDEILCRKFPEDTVIFVTDKNGMMYQAIVRISIDYADANEVKNQMIDVMNNHKDKCKDNVCKMIEYTDNNKYTVGYVCKYCQEKIDKGE